MFQEFSKSSKGVPGDFMSIPGVFKWFQGSREVPGDFGSVQELSWGFRGVPECFKGVTGDFRGIPGVIIGFQVCITPFTQCYRSVHVGVRNFQGVSMIFQETSWLFQGFQSCSKEFQERSGGLRCVPGVF